MNQLIFGFEDIDKSKLNLAGGKGANLGELSKIEGINVPDGFCISAEAYKKIIDETPLIDGLLDRLSLLTLKDKDILSELCSDIRKVIEDIVIPQEVSAGITSYLNAYGDKTAWAVRSSATSEDMPTTSFAGQYDTYLNITGKESIMKHVSRCWASLFTERAVAYRLQNGFDHRKVQLAVVVQKMIFPDVSGILFTADPVTSNRKVSSIDAAFGLGEAIVSGLVNADSFKVIGSKLISGKISTKKLAIYAAQKGGTKRQVVDPVLQRKQALTEKQIFQLEKLGRKIEEHFGSPQDIEWCLADDIFYIVQSRPITTLYPIPSGGTGTGDLENHVYLSVGHNQMMTDAIKPLGLSFFLLTTPGPMSIAGGRLFVDVTNHLASRESRKKLMDTAGQSDPLIKDALKTILSRKGFIKPSREVKVQSSGYIDKVLPWSYLSKFEKNPAIVHDLIKSSQVSIEELKENIRTKSGADLFHFILQDIPQLKKVLFSPESWEVIKVALYASAWINKKMLKWLGEKNAADILARSVPDNITSEMGLALLDVADIIRPFPEVIEYLQNKKDNIFWDELLKLKGGKKTSDAINAFLSKYGMRCAGEIDITRTRWNEKPSILIPTILSNIRNFETRAAKHRFEQGRQEAREKELELMEGLKQLPGGKRKAAEARRMISLLRNLIGYREYPKYAMINRYFIYKQALLREAENLVKAGVIHEKEDVYFLTFEELREVVHTLKFDYQIIIKRKEDYSFYEKLTPPRVITSDGEIISGNYKRKNQPARAFSGLGVSSGITEGRARIILNIQDANLEEGDILVTSYTDPSWTPLFVSVKGLVTEVGGMMTHGAVIAREYGLPAVTGVENATRLIRNGQRIRINGTEGYVEVL